MSRQPGGDSTTDWLNHPGSRTVFCFGKFVVAPAILKITSCLEKLFDVNVVKGKITDNGFAHFGFRHANS
ncbi:MAG: hypothetical protein M3Y76_11370 [Chloroflexota bacterium]|nr:hypothetical protein [Chloroflexota bacterium]